MKLYKYYPLSPYSKKFLHDQEVYFSPFRGLNDPFEIAVRYSFNCTYEKKHAYFMKHVDVFNQFQPEFQKSYIEDFEKNYSHSHGYLAHMLRNSMSHLGIFCLSTNPLEILMWSHYTNKHRGFCVEFETNNDPAFKELVQVDYVDDFQEALFYDGVKIGEAVSKKFRVWSYENEWRAIHTSGVHKLDPKCIERIFVGPLNRFVPSEKNEFGDHDVWFDVVREASKCLPNVKFQNLKISNQRYELERF